MIPFPLWLRAAHLINVIFLTLLVRSGIEILSGHPKLYAHDNTADGTEWIKFTKKEMPKDRLWTSDDEMEAFNSVIALPGGSQIGLGRHWHFFSVIFWLANGISYCALLFMTGVWQTLIPTSWSIFPEAFNAMMTFASGRLPPTGNPFDPVQQLAYAGVVFILGPLMIATGAGMSPAVGARFPHYPRIFGGRQMARSLHFLTMLLFVLFIVVHVALVVVDGFQENMANIIYGGGEISLGLAVTFLLLYFAIVFGVHVFATEYSLKRPRSVQNRLGTVLEPVRRTFMHRLASKQHLDESRVTTSFRINGRPPETDDYKSLVKENFAAWRLKVNGLVDRPLDLSIEDLQSMQKSTQITEHTCIQGWTAVAEWGGVRMSNLIALCKPHYDAKYVVFHSMAYGEKDEYGHGDSTTKFYEVITMEMAKQEQTILAYEMNHKPLTVEHGAPLRLRVEVQYGYKMVKWLDSVQFVDDYRRIGAGQGGHREDSKYFGRGAWI